MALALAAAAAAGLNRGAPPPPPAAWCDTDAHCSYNGVCTAADRQCVCDLPWGGPTCGLLQVNGSLGIHYY